MPNNVDGSMPFNSESDTGRARPGRLLDDYILYRLVKERRGLGSLSELFGVNACTLFWLPLMKHGGGARTVSDNRLPATTRLKGENAPGERL